MKRKQRIWRCERCGAWKRRYIINRLGPECEECRNNAVGKDREKKPPRMWPAVRVKPEPN